MSAGGNFWKGTAIGLMNGGLNHLQGSIQFFRDQKRGFRHMQAWQKKNGKEIAGASATREDWDGEGLLVEFNQNNKEQLSSLNFTEKDGTRFV